MNYNVLLALAVVCVLIIISVWWNRFFMSYLKKCELRKVKSKETKKEKILYMIKPALCLSNCVVLCTILLCNTDDDISKALEYIQPSKHLNNLLEKLNEQAGI